MRADAPTAVAQPGPLRLVVARTACAFSALLLCACVATTAALNDVKDAQQRLALVQADQTSTVAELDAAQANLDEAILSVKAAGEADALALKEGAKGTLTLVEGILGGGGILTAALGLGARALSQRDKRKAKGGDPLEARLATLETAVAAPAMPNWSSPQ